jgi:penicillin-binding protein A
MASRWRRWLGIGAAMGVILALVPVVQGRIELDNPLRKLAPRGGKDQAPPKLEGLDLLRLSLRPQRVTAPLKGNRHAELTLDPVVQRAALAQMKRFRIPEAGAVVMDVKTGRLLAYASYVASGEPFDVNARAEAPAASVFKVVTGAALVEKGGLNANTEQCYHGGKSRIAENELEDDPRRDRWCATLGIALGRSLNVVFARLAKKHLTPEELTEMGGAFGFGAPVKFAAPNEAPQINIPDNPVDFARTAAGFWNTSLSPLAAVLIAQTVANDGVTLEPRIVASVYDGESRIWEDSGEPHVVRRAIKHETAAELTRMMLQTVESGSAWKSFHDGRGKPYLPGVRVAGKTGTLTREEANRFYTWFIGFATADKPEVAIAVLVVNTPNWKIKAPLLAREVLRAYFANKGYAGVTAP